VTGTRKPTLGALLLAALVAAALALAPAAGAATGGIAAPHAGTPAPAPPPATLTLAPAAAKHRAAPVKLAPPATVRVGRVALGTTPEGTLAVLTAIRYPIQALGREMSADIRIAIPGRDFHSIVTDRVSAGGLRKGDRRRSFTFVHEFPLHPRVAAAVLLAQGEGKPVEVRVTANGAIDVNGDGKPDLSSSDSRASVLPLTPLAPAYGSGAKPATNGKRADAATAAKPFCASIPRLRLNPGQRVEYPLPACSRPVDWKVLEQPQSGSARVIGNAIAIQAPKQPGPMEFTLPVGPTVEVDVATPKAVSVRAIGDSVTAGFGYYSDGSLMSLLDLYECKPAGQFLNDACSSNSTSTHDTEKAEPVPYAPDYGLANNVSWAAQWANKYDVTNYENLAVSGSEPVNWAPGGSLYATTKAVEAEDPDYILMTVGANPILSETLFGADPMGCALYADIFGNYAECVEAAFAKVDLRGELRSLYTDLVTRTESTIYLMQYHLAIPSSALLYSSTQIAEIGVLMNRTIAEVAAEVSPSRLHVVTPPQFATGLDLEPVVAATYECGYYLTDKVDGPSVQSTLTQDQLQVLHPLEFCPQKKGEAPWVISGDTGIHPSAEGYFQMASRVPAPN
jgi:lysophospholipase L1-like esterase